MNNHNNLTETEKVACEICLNEVPHSEAQTAEVDDYVVHFCGLECYEQWSEEKTEKE